MHILLITQAFPESESDESSVVYLQNYVTCLIENPSVHLTVVALQYPFEKRQYSWKGIQVCALGNFKKPRLAKVLSWIPLILKLIRMGRKTPFTHIHVLWLKEGAFIGYILKKILGIPMSCTLMGTELNVKNPFSFLGKKNTIRFITVSPFHEQQFINRFPDAERVTIPWGIMPVKGSIPRQKSTDILFVGYLSKTKDFDLFLDIVKEVVAEKPDLKAGVIGDYFGLESFIQQAEQKGIKDNITFFGLLANNEVLERMKTSKILLHTSSYETQGYAMLEALAHGMYVVSRQVGIAEASERWHIADNKNDFVEIISNILSRYQPLETYVPYTMEETCRKYLKIYSNP